MSEDERHPDDEMTAHASTDEPGDADTYDLTDSDQDTGGDMGVSSEREGPTGPGQHGTTGVRDVGPADRDPGADVLPEQAAGGPETNPDPPVPPVAGWSSSDPRSGGDGSYEPNARRAVDRDAEDDGA